MVWSRMLRAASTLLTVNTMPFAGCCLTGSMKTLPMTRECTGQIHSPSPKTGISISRQTRYTDRQFYTGTKNLREKPKMVFRIKVDG
ncbi:MAG: hypothetical protein H6Q54_897 [Deltaproteobacteria bacterium]|nr:hypothetical protein [Deltaproteobacteria bacterium]